MKLQCKTEQLKNAVFLAEKMTGKNLTLPTLHALLLIATNKTLKIRSTNLAVGIEIDIPADVLEEGTVLIKGDILSNVINNAIGKNFIKLEVVNENIVITNELSTSTIKCLPQEDFPTIPVVEGESFEIKSSVLQEGIRSVYFCSAMTDIKPEISSVFIYTEEENFVFVSTDSFRLAEKKIKVKHIPDISKILLPYKSIPDVLRVLDFINGEISICFNRNQLSISGGGIYFTTRVIDGAFPDYKTIIPQTEKTKIIVMKQELVSILKLSTIFADKFFQILFNVDIKNKKVFINSKNSDIGNSTSSIDAVIEGDDIEVSFNLKYFLDVFQTISSDSLLISFTETNRPIIIKGIQDNSFLYLLMPTNR
jgi:DNA polymerase-3 subunit beta